MHPNFFEDAPAKAGQRRFQPVRWLVNSLWGVVRGCWRLLMYDPLSRISGFKVEEGTPASRFIRAVLYRLAFVPVLMAATACAIVWTATHPRTVAVEVDPAWQGIYYEAVTFVGQDNVPIEGWLMPMLNAKVVLEEKEKILRKKHPAVVLVHDIGQRREQMLPLVKPLHEAGFVVLAINLRGGGLHAMAGETFGLHEASDVKAAVELLGKRQFVDPHRIAIVGCGTGASAALLAAQLDPTVAAVVAQRPNRDTRDLLDSRIMPQNGMLNWLSPLCKWTFEISYGVDLEELNVSKFAPMIGTRHVLLVDASGTHADPSDSRMIDQTTGYLLSVFKPSDHVAGVK